MDTYLRCGKNWTRPVVVLHYELTNQVVFEKLAKSYQIHCMGDMLPYSLYFPASAATFLLVDFHQDFRFWTLNKSNDLKKLSWLANFAQKNEGANVIYLCSKVDEHVTSVFYDVQRRVEFMTAKTLISGFATSWKSAVNYMKQMAEGLSMEKIEQEQEQYQKDLQFVWDSNGTNIVL